MPYRVLKPIPADDGQSIPSGEIVDAEGWRNLRQLVNGKFLVEVVSAADPVNEDEPTAKPRSTKPKK
jgi:hypothetical protein